MLWKSNGGGDFEQAPLGTHVARCVRLIDIGTQEGEYGSKRQVVVSWELCDELMTQGDFAGQPFLISKYFTQSLNEKSNLRKWLITWRGRDFTPEELEGFDAKNILGVPCLLSIIANEKSGKSMASGAMKLTKGHKAPAQITPTVFFSLEPGEFDRSVFDGLSDYYRTMIEASPEYQDLIKPKAKPVPAGPTDLDEWPAEDGPELDFSEEEDDGNPDF